MFILSTSLPLGLDFKEVLLHLLNFFILLTVLYFLLYKPIKNFMAKRDAEYKSAQESAQEGMEQAEQAKKESEQLIKDARQKAVQITQDALESASLLQKEIVENAEVQAKNILEKADIQAEKVKAEAQEELIYAAGEIGLQIAGKILEREVEKSDNDTVIKHVLEHWKD